jgi:hypothetical protein
VSARPTTPSPLLSALFGVALLGVLVAGGLLAFRLGGLAAVLGYAALTGLLLALGVARVRRLVAPSAPLPRTCTCCGTADHTAPVTLR